MRATATTRATAANGRHSSLRSLCSFVATLLIAFALACRPAYAASPNVLLIVVESLRYDHLSGNGYSRPTTPCLDRLAAEGAAFRLAFAASNWTMPSVMSLHTSTPPAVHGLTASNRRLTQGLATLAGAFRQAGYATAGIVSNPLLNGKFGFARGFDLYDDFTIVNEVGVDFVEGDTVQPTLHQRDVSDQVTRQARNWLRRRDPSRPFFLFVFYFDPHYDYTPLPAYAAMFSDPDYNGAQDGKGITALQGKPLTASDKAQLMALYDAEIRYTDEHIGALLQAVDTAGLRDRTITVVTADHGEEFWDHGGVAHGHTLYDELVHVPWIIRYPPRIPAGAVVGVQVTHLDLMPTLLDLAGLPVPAQCEGHSLVSVAEGKAPAADAPPAFFASQARGRVAGARTPALKLVEREGAPNPEMYAVRDDPQERTNLYGTAREQEFAALNREFQQWKERMTLAANSAKPEPPIKLDAQLVRQLRSLGYAR